MTPKALRDLRHRLGLSQSDFAAKLGVASDTISRWERGVLGLRQTSQLLIEKVAAEEARRARRRNRRDKK